MIEGQIEAVTDAFLKGAAHFAQQGVGHEVLVNALISAAITCCYVEGEPPEKVRKALRDAANLVVALYERQDQIDKRLNN